MIRQFCDWLATPSYPTYGSNLLTDVWNPRRSTPRRPIFQRSLFSHDYPHGGYGKKPTITLDDQTFTFETGRWVGEAGGAAKSRPSSRGSSQKRPESAVRSGSPQPEVSSKVRSLKEEVRSLKEEVPSLKEEVRSLEEENNALKLRVEVLLDMLTETTATALGLERNLKDAKKALKKKVKERQEVSQ